VTAARRITYCRQCAAEVTRERSRAWRKNKNAQQTDPQREAREELHTCDPDNVVKVCLSCTKTKCTGECELVERANTQKWTITEAEEEEIMRMYREGFSRRKISETLGHSFKTVRRVVELHGGE